MVKENTMKQTEIGFLPEDWEIVKLSDVSNVKTGPFGSALHEKDYVLDGIPIITVEHLGERGVLKSNYPMVSQADYKRLSNYVLYKGDIVFSRVGSVDRNSLIKENEESWLFSGRLLRIKPNKKVVSSEYLSFFFHQNSFKVRILSVAVGQTMASLNTKILNDILIYLPPLPEQEAIAEALSDADAWIETLEQLIAKKRLIKQGAMQELLTPKEDWEVKKLGEVIDVYRGGSPRPIQDFITDKLDGINWIKIGDTPSSGKYIVSCNEKIIPEGEKNSRRVYAGDFLLSNSMSFGRPYILKIDGCIHDGWLVLQNYKSSFDTEFLYYLLTSKYILDQYKSKAAGSGVLNLNKQVVNTVELTIPSLTEQTCIATILLDMDAELESLEAQLAKARQVKQGMMQELLTGRVRLV